MHGKRVLGVDGQHSRVIEVALNVLGIRNVEQRILSFGIFLVTKDVRDGAKNIDANLEVGPYGMLTVIIMEVYAGLKDEEILVVILQNGISARHIVKVVGLERLRNPRHVHVVDVKEVESVRAMSSVVLPMISPCTRKDTSVKLGTVLEIIAEEKLRLEIQLFLEALGKEGRYDAEEHQLGIHIILLIILVLIAVKT